MRFANTRTSSSSGRVSAAARQMKARATATAVAPPKAAPVQQSRHMVDGVVRYMQAPADGEVRPPGGSNLSKDLVFGHELRVFDWRGLLALQLGILLACSCFGALPSRSNCSLASCSKRISISTGFLRGRRPPTSSGRSTQSLSQTCTACRRSSPWKTTALNYAGCRSLPTSTGRMSRRYSPVLTSAFASHLSINETGALPSKHLAFYSWELNESGD